MPLAELKSPVPLTQHCTYRLAGVEDAEAITAVYEHVFGKNGIKAPGHEPYPAPEVFSAEGVRGVIADSARQFIVAELKGQIAGGMIVNLLSSYNCEFCCVAVDPLYRGLGITAPMLGYARQLAEATALTINSTEIVTHSVLSQTAHNRAGYGKVVGFGYCQYPRVFFASHPESVLWVCEIQGRVADALRSRRMHGREDAEEILFSDDEDLRLLRSLSRPRHVYVPDNYGEVVKEILWQYTDTIDYSIGKPDDNAAESIGLKQVATAVDSAHDAPYGYLHLPSNLYPKWQKDLDVGIDSLKGHGKRYIQARIPANSTSAVDYAEYLQAKGFIFLGLLPLHGVTSGQNSEPVFHDLLVLQWVDDGVVIDNELPGETDSVIKLYGHPANLTGLVLKVMRNELRERSTSKELPCGV